jgi:hypothetical protein
VSRLKADSPHWLDDVRAVLEADTGDLRALAQIAGEDPRTLYIGTDLAGVDVRGQDLRGIGLSNIDRDRVLHDEHTRWNSADLRADADNPAGPAPSTTEKR